MRRFSAGRLLAVGGVPFFVAPGFQGLLRFAAALLEAAAFAFVFVGDELRLAGAPLARTSPFAAGNDLLFDLLSKVGLGVVGGAGLLFRGLFGSSLCGGFAGSQGWTSVE